MNRHLFTFLVFTAAIFAKAQVAQDAVNLHFADGTVLDIHTESNGATVPRSTIRPEDVTPGYDYHRLVLGSEKVLLGYDIEARKTGPGIFSIRIKPTNKDQVRIGGRGRWLDIPTITGIREFPGLRIGDTVRVDILEHPVTAEKIYDLLRVSKDAPASRATSKPVPQRFSLKDVRVAVNGKTIRKLPNGCSGGGLMIHLPGRGTYYFALSPPPDATYRPSAWVDHTVLRFHAGTDLVEVLGETNVLDNSDFATVWVYRDRALKRPPAAGNSVAIACGDDVRSLLRLNNTIQK